MLKNKIFLYCLFALLASIVNVIGQHIFLNYNENLFFAVIVGSAAGLVFKYVLDSRIVFEGKKPIAIVPIFLDVDDKKSKFSYNDIPVFSPIFALDLSKKIIYRIN